MCSIRGLHTEAKWATAVTSEGVHVMYDVLLLLSLGGSRGRDCGDFILQKSLVKICFKKTIQDSDCDNESDCNIM